MAKKMPVTDQMLMLSVLGKEMIPEFEFAGKDALETDLETIKRLHGKKRKWRFDYAIPNEKIALEVDGGVWVGGRHTTGSGFTKDVEKFNTAAALGWLVFKCTPSTKSRTEALEAIKITLESHQ